MLTRQLFLVQCILSINNYLSHPEQNKHVLPCTVPHDFREISKLGKENKTTSEPGMWHCALPGLPSVKMSQRSHVTASKTRRHDFPDRVQLRQENNILLTARSSRKGWNHSLHGSSRSTGGSATKFEYECFLRLARQAFGSGA